MSLNYTCLSTVSRGWLWIYKFTKEQEGILSESLGYIDVTIKGILHAIVYKLVLHILHVSTVYNSHMCVYIHTLF